ncbi:atp binding protein, partial [Moniliophthora roreri]
MISNEGRLQVCHPMTRYIVGSPGYKGHNLRNNFIYW